MPDPTEITVLMSPDLDSVDLPLPIGDGYEPVALTETSAAYELHGSKHTFVCEAVLEREAPSWSIYECLAQTAKGVESLHNVVGLVSAHVTLSRTYGAISISRGDTPEVEFELKNRRRHFLIGKHYAGGLTENEERELEQLRDDVAATVAERHPLPFDYLESFEALLDEDDA